MDDISHELLTEALPKDLSGKNVLLLGCEPRLSETCLHHGAKHVVAVHLSWILFSRASNNENIENIFGDPASKDLPLSDFDVILFPITKSTIHNMKLIAFCQSVLSVSGIINLAGVNNGGIKGLASKLKKQNITAVVKANKRGGRVLEIKSTPEIASNLYTSSMTQYEFRGETIEVKTVPGLFSYGKSDNGTQLLLDHFPKCSKKKILDVGCGSGVLSIAGEKAGADMIVAVDASATAINLSNENCSSFNHIKVQPGDMAHNVEGFFDMIVTNPPFHDGFKTDLSTGERWLNSLLPRLHKGGVVWLVANAFISYGIMGRKCFGSVERVAEENGFILYKMVK